MRQPAQSGPATPPSQNRHAASLCFSAPQPLEARHAESPPSLPCRRHRSPDRLRHPAHTLAVEVKNGSVKSLQGSPLMLPRAGTYVTVEDAMVVRADLPASNGVVHLVDRVLLPPAPN